MGLFSTGGLPPTLSQPHHKTKEKGVPHNGREQTCEKARGQEVLFGSPLRTLPLSAALPQTREGMNEDAK